MITDKYTMWQARVLLEKFELDEKIAKLGAYRRGMLVRHLSPNDRMLLWMQYHGMRFYSYILAERIKGF
jgi:hypothetical protein